MPTITRTMIKTALVYALLGMTLSRLWLIEIAVPLPALVDHLQPTALHLVVIGWLTQLILRCGTLDVSAVVARTTARTKHRYLELLRFAQRRIGAALGCRTP